MDHPPNPQAVIGRGFDENLQQGACWPCSRVMNAVRVFAEDFAAKLAPSRSSRHRNIHLKNAKRHASSWNMNLQLSLKKFTPQHVL